MKLHADLKLIVEVCLNDGRYPSTRGKYDTDNNLVMNLMGYLKL